jgi:hypothetical protein
LRHSKKITHYLLIPVKYSVNNIDIIFHVFLGPDKHLQVSECSVAVGSGTSEDHLSSQNQGAYALLTANK